ncbi:MAG: PilZ domain-containing protein [Myxococcaceae bacterium]
MKSTKNERRRHPRIPVKLQIKRKTTTHAPESVEYATDLSEGGLFIRTKETSVKKGATLEIAFSPSGHTKEVQARGRVVRVTNEGLAIEFLELDPDSRILLGYALAS